jgi:hypothetical protein
VLRLPSQEPFEFWSSSIVRHSWQPHRKRQSTSSVSGQMVVNGVIISCRDVKPSETVGCTNGRLSVWLSVFSVVPPYATFDLSMLDGISLLFFGTSRKSGFGEARTRKYFRDGLSSEGEREVAAITVFDVLLILAAATCISHPSPSDSPLLPWALQHSARCASSPPPIGEQMIAFSRRLSSRLLILPGSVLAGKQYPINEGSR